MMINRREAIGSCLAAIAGAACSGPKASQKAMSNVFIEQTLAYSGEVKWQSFIDFEREYLEKHRLPTMLVEYGDEGGRSPA